MCIAWSIPVAFATNAESTSDNSIIQIEFDEYMASKSHYKALLQEGYTLIIHVGEKNEDAGVAEFLSCDESALPEDLIMPYGNGIPTTTWDVSLQGSRSINGTSTDTLGYLFTNFIFTGCSAYEADIYNRGTSTLKAAFMEKGSIDPFASFSVPAQSVAVRYVTKYSWYGRFTNPCKVEGTVFKFVMT